jgi:hypothetical protein
MWDGAGNAGHGLSNTKQFWSTGVCFEGDVFGAGSLSVVSMSILLSVVDALLCTSFCVVFTRLVSTSCQWSKITKQLHTTENIHTITHKN